MSEESTTPDLVELVRSQVDAADSGDIDVMASFLPRMGSTTRRRWDSRHEGRAAIRRFFQDWWSAYDVSGAQAGEILDLGNGVTFAVVILRGGPVGGGEQVHLRYAAVEVWVEGEVTRITNYTDIDEARVAAERLAEERG